MKLVLIEDYEPARDALASILGRQGDIDVVASFGTAEAGLMFIEGNDVDVVVVDFSLPGMNGASFCAMAASFGVAIIVHSGDLTAEDEERCIAAGAFRCVRKAVNPGALLDAIRAAAGAR
jgi:DNA-binding NarL/FixJ family response regulator